MAKKIPGKGDVACPECERYLEHLASCSNAEPVTDLALPLLLSGLGPTQLRVLIMRIVEAYSPHPPVVWLEEQVADIKRTRPELEQLICRKCISDPCICMVIT